MPMGFGGMFDILEALFPIFFIAVFGIVAAGAIAGIRQWSRNNHSPVLTVDARVVNLRTDVRGHHGADHGDASPAMIGGTDTRYYATFQVESGDRIELGLSGREYGLLAPGDSGKLTFQGTRYQGFERAR